MGILNALKKLKNKNRDKKETDNVIFEREDDLNIKEISNEIEEFWNKDNIEDIIIENKELTEEEIELLIIEEINKVIEVNNNFEEVKVKAREAAENIGVKYLDRIPKYLGREKQIFDKYHDKYENRDYFNVVVDNSILMIIFSFKDNAVEILEKISQKSNNFYLKATNLLCKLASEKVKTEEILDNIISNIMLLNDENRIATLGFMSQIKDNGRVIGIIQYFYKDYLKKGEIENAFKLLNHLISAAERYTEGHLKFLKEISHGNKKINLQHIMVLEENDPKYIMVDKISEELRVEAAITYYLINPNDKEVKDTLKYLAEYSLNEKLREKIRKVIYQ